MPTRSRRRSIRRRSKASVRKKNLRHKRNVRYRSLTISPYTEPGQLRVGQKYKIKNAATDQYVLGPDNQIAKFTFLKHGDLLVFTLGQVEYSVLGTHYWFEHIPNPEAEIP